MTSVSIRFGGEIINELSNKIPTSLFALNELIKNAYDAFSPEVTITVIPSKNKITIVDKGNGMERHDIDSLFHVSRSTKTYGKEITQDGKTRITQGSKGLGFLSAFKFGDKVIWKTCKNGEVNMFSARKSDLVSRDDVSGVEIPITTDVGKEDGTEIIISTSKEEMDDLLIELSDNKISEKLVSSIIN
ncbi:histidine kinase, partial [Vibrio parahaemolyticus]|nr:histidine kinase [Vibrio parahaemolyticus]